MDRPNAASRVLIVDDMRINCMLLASLLQSHGVASDMAESGEECLALFKENEYDLILMDHRMPGIDGVDTLVRLKELFEENGREIPVVCHTTEAGRENVNLYKAAGFADVLFKPIDPRELYRMLKACLPEGAMTEEEDSGERDRQSAEVAKLPGSLRDVEGLNLKAGIDSCETAEDYLDALRIFAGSAMSKARDIENFCEKEDYDGLALKVHSVESMGRLIGAIELADEAAELEKAGKDKLTAVIKEKAPGFLAHYRSLHDRLKDI